jgi:excisionase family DNA binding protein
LAIKTLFHRQLIPNATPKAENDDMTDANQFDAKTCSRQEAAIYLGISTRTFDRIQIDRAIAYVMVGKRRRYMRSDLDTYLKANRSI